MDTLNIILSAFNFVLLVFFLIYWLLLQNIKADSNKQGEKVRNKADRILEKAHQEAELILAQAKKTSLNLQKSADEIFLKTVEKINLQNEEYYKNATIHLEKSILDFSEKLSKKSEKELTEYGSKIHQEVSKKSNILEDKIKEIIDIYSKEIEEFKVNEKERVRLNIQERIDNIVKDLLPSNILLSDHDKLVEEAINKANKEGLFK